jgi:hypothetical protein
VDDGCVASTAMTDGGVALDTHATLTCRAVTDGVVFQVCLNSADAGTLDPGSATFRARIFH